MHIRVAEPLRDVGHLHAEGFAGRAENALHAPDTVGTRDAFQIKQITPPRG